MAHMPAIPESWGQCQRQIQLAPDGARGPGTPRERGSQTHHCTSPAEVSSFVVRVDAVVVRVDSPVLRVEPRGSWG